MTDNIQGLYLLQVCCLTETVEHYWNGVCANQMLRPWTHRGHSVGSRCAQGPKTTSRRSARCESGIRKGVVGRVQLGKLVEYCHSPPSPVDNFFHVLNPILRVHIQWASRIWSIPSIGDSPSVSLRLVIHKAIPTDLLLYHIRPVAHALD